MSTTAEKLQKIIDIKNDLKEKINAKGGSITDTTPFAEYPIQVENISGGGSVDTTGKHKVTYFDVDGSALKVEYVEDGGTTTPPSDPSYDSEYLQFDCWNYDVANLVVDRDINIGAIYETITGDSYLFIRLTEKIGLSPSLNISGTTSIDWGDGTVDTNLNHTYADYGEYVIKISGMTSITTYLFGSSSSVYNYSLQKCYLGNTVTTIVDDAFCNCYSLTSIVIPESVTSIHDYAFNNCYSLTSIVIPESVTSIGSVFSGCYSLTSIVIPEGVTSIGTSAFTSCCNLTSIVIPESVTSIGNEVFYNCYSLTSVVIPESVTSIGNSAFCSCRSLTSIVIPESVTSIGSLAFSSCYSLKNYIFNCSIVPTLSSSNVFGSNNKSVYIWVRDELVDEYKATINWLTYASYIKPLSSMSDKLREELGL